MDGNAPCVSIGDFPHDTQKAGFRPTLVVTTPQRILVFFPNLLMNPLLSFLWLLQFFSSQNTTIYHCMSNPLVFLIYFITFIIFFLLGIFENWEEQKNIWENSKWEIGHFNTNPEVLCFESLRSMDVMILSPCPPQWSGNKNEWRRRRKWRRL